MIAVSGLYCLKMNYIFVEQKHCPIKLFVGLQYKLLYDENILV